MTTDKKKSETVGDLLKGLSEEEIEGVKTFYGIIFGEDFPPLDAPADEPTS
jgi:hypothetical protein